MTSFKIFVISDYSGREEALLVELNSAKLSYQIQEAIFFQKIPDFWNSKLSYLMTRRKLSINELGCASAHQNTYDFMVHNEVSFALVFEDDAIINNIDGLLKSIHLAISQKFAPGFILSFYSENAEIPRSNPDGLKIRKCYSPPSGAVCYLLDFDAARILLEANQSLIYPPDWPLTEEIDFYINVEKLVSHSGSSSYLDVGRNKNKISAAKRFVNLLDLFLLSRYLKIRRIHHIDFGKYMTLLYVPTFTRYMRKMTRISRRFHS